MRVLVTGASGFLGGYVCADLAGAGHEVWALVRRPGSAPEGTAEVVGDITGDASSLAAAVAGAAPDCVVHLAAEIASQRDAKRIHAVNVEGTRALLTACAAAAGSPKVVFASTVVTGDAGGELLDEHSELPVHTAYGRSKQEGERLVRESQLPAVVVRPSHVYGAGGWFVEEFVDRLRQPGRFAVIGNGRNLWDVVRVEDVALAFRLAAEDGADGATYHVADDEPIAFRDFVGLAAQALGVGAPRSIPAWLARLVAGADPVAAVTRSARSSNARIKRELGWSPRFPRAADGVPDAVRLLRSS